MKKILTFLFLSLISFTQAAPAQVTTEARADVAQKQVNATTLGIYVKGFVCESCGIGIRKKMQKLPFINRQRFNQGLKLDADNQLVYLALQPGKKTDYKAISSAIKSAGYTPVTYFTTIKGQPHQIASQ